MAKGCRAGRKGEDENRILGGSDGHVRKEDNGRFTLEQMEQHGQVQCIGQQ